MTRHPLRPITGLALAAALVACTANEPPKAPTPPDVEGLLTEFEIIDGTLDAESAQALVQGAAEDAVTLAAIGALMIELDAAVSELGTATESEPEALTAHAAQGRATAPHIGQRTHALNAEGGGWARVTHICPGADRDVVDQANGDIELRTVFDALDIIEDGLSRIVVWGEATACLLSTDDGISTLDADITGAMVLNETSDLLLSIVGTLHPPAGETSPFDLRLRQSGSVIELLRTVDDVGSFLIGLEQLDDGLQQATLTDVDGTWTCTFDTEDETGTCTRDGEVLSWP